ncbi:MAG: hypothetical protein R3A10_00670 [Caldilineaceae bacterium]
MATDALIPLSTPVATAAAGGRRRFRHTPRPAAALTVATGRPARDTLSEIAKAFAPPMLAILEYNDLPTETVYAAGPLHSLRRCRCPWPPLHHPAPYSLSV